MEKYLRDAFRAHAMIVSDPSVGDKVDVVYLGGLSEGMVASAKLFGFVGDHFWEEIAPPHRLQWGGWPQRFAGQ